jgi:regulator of replication initiation timing
METLVHNQSLLHQDILPLFLQSKRQINQLQTRVDQLLESNHQLLLENEELKSDSICVKSLCANCEHSSVLGSDFDNDSVLYQKIFDKNMEQVGMKEAPQPNQEMSNFQGQMVSAILEYVVFCQDPYFL